MKTCLVLILSIVVLSSCEMTTSTPTTYVGLTHAAFRLDVSNPGSLHNEIAVAYANRRLAFGDRPITRKEFVHLMVDASNESFAKNGRPAIVTAPDINRVIDEIHDLRRRNVFNFFSHEPGAPSAIVDDWEKRGIISHVDAAAVKKELRNEDSNSSSKPIWAFQSVYDASMALWSDRAFTKKLGIVDRRMQLLDGETPPDKSKLAYEMDSIGTLLGWFLGGPGGSVLGGAIFSWAYYECPPADLGQWESPGYYMA